MMSSSEDEEGGGIQGGGGSRGGHSAALTLTLTLTITLTLIFSSTCLIGVFDLGESLAPLVLGGRPEGHGPSRDPRVASPLSGRGDGRARAFRTRSVGGRDDGRA